MQRIRLGSMVTATLGLFAACLLTIATVSQPAAASIEYPALVKSTWGLSKLPVPGDGCPLCHTTDPGMLGTANQKFAVTLKGFGAQAMSDGLLKAALAKDQAKMTDSDGDGFSDYEELFSGTNPNIASDHPTPMPMNTGSSGSGNDTGANSDAGAESDVVGAAGTDSGADGLPADGSLASCGTTQTIYPTLKTGCNFGGGSPSSNSPLLAGVLAACLIRRGARAGKRRREKRGQQA